MITTNVLQRVFNIRFQHSTGTCFAIDVDDRQYLVTAAHMGEGIGKTATLEIFHDSQWKTLGVSRVGQYKKEEIDVAVLAPERQLAHPEFVLEPSASGIIYGQEVFFLGFPYGMSGEVGEFNRNFPVPFVKKAILSSPPKFPGALIFYLDGHNNPGFSGGPVIFKEHGGEAFKVASVISAFRHERHPVLEQGKPSSSEYSSNTGIIVSYGIKHALDAIHLNPIGCPIQAPK